MNSKVLREKLGSEQILKVGGAYDAMSAKLVEIHGFDAIWAGSFAISATHALPDASILTMTEFLHAAANMVETCKIPVIADCDTGFGGPSNVGHMVKKYESAGVAAICIEDKVFPKRNSLLEGVTQELLPEKDFVAKLIAAKDAKKSNDFMVIARVEALIAGLGIDEAIKRANAYENAGADAILIHSKKNTSDEIFEFCDVWKGKIPLVVVPTNYPSVTINELVSHKIKMVIFANHTLRAAYTSISNTLDRISKTNSLSEANLEISSMDKIFDLQEMYELKEQEKEIERNLKKLGYM